MATAPRPGASRRADEVRDAKRVTRITIKGESHDVALNNLPMRIRNRVRKQCDGLPLSAYFQSDAVIDDDSLKVLWWVARMADGEDSLTLQTVDDNWWPDLTLDDVSMEIIDADQATAEELENSPES